VNPPADELLARARAGDSEAFGELTDPYCRELLVHCYRMLGSYQDAEDALQESLLAAWQGLQGFESRASVRTWLYRITTNRCLNAHRAASRRPLKEWDVPNVNPPAPTQLGEVTWLEPIPDSAIDLDMPLGPDAIYEQTESIKLAFVTALQALPPRQLAVLVLRDVLGFRAAEVAQILDASVDSVNGALKRARQTLSVRRTSDEETGTGVKAKEEVVEQFMHAWEGADIDAVVGLLSDDVFLSMPPLPWEYVGPEAVGDFFRRFFEAARRYRLVRTQANGQPAFGAYLRSAHGVSHAVGILVLDVTASHVTAITRFEPSNLARFGLPRSI
jgi:RNA polymerase sigma-70 factor (ECF subfamily)